MSDEYEALNDALMEIRAAKFKLQERLRALQTREWQLMDDITKRRSVKREQGNVSTEKHMSQSEWVSLNRVTRSKENVWSEFEQG